MGHTVLEVRAHRFHGYGNFRMEFNGKLPAERALLLQLRLPIEYHGDWSLGGLLRRR